MAITMGRGYVGMAAAAVCAAGLGLSAVPANAIPPFPLAPACANYTMPPQLVLNLSNGETATFSTFGGSMIGTGVDKLAAERGPYTGTSNGTLSGSSLNIKVRWEPDFVRIVAFDDPAAPAAVDSTFSGTVGPDGIARGSAVDNTGFRVDWTSRDKLTCTDAPAAQAPPAEQAPPPPAPPKKCPEGSVKPEVPATENCAAPTNTVTMNISGGALTRTVTVNNSGPLGGSCAYNATATSGIFAPPLSRTIDVGPNDQNSIDVPAPPIGSTYRVTLTCTGTYDGKQVQFGQAQQDVSA